MHTKGPKEDPLIDMGYEIRDVNLKSIKMAVVYFFTFATLMFGAGAVIYWKMSPTFDPKFANTPEHMVVPKPPYPILQDNVSNFTDIMHLRQHETAVLTSTGYTDVTKKYVHIPIERAIDILAERGLPKTTAVMPAISKGNTTDEKKFANP